MKRFLLIVVFGCLIIFLASCSNKDAITPNDRFNDYVKLWNSQKFEKMYDFLPQDTQKKFPPEKFIDRYKKVYKDLDIHDLKISFHKLEEDTLDRAMDKGTATVPFTVKMDSVAGPIHFDYKAKMVRKTDKDDEENWYIAWDPGFIFPEIKNGGDIHIDTEEPQRGEIIDRNKMPLAMNDTVWQIGVVPSKLKSDSSKEEIAKLLHMSTKEIDSKMNADWVKPDLFVPLKKIQKSDPAADQLWAIEGVAGQEVSGRVYPLGKAAAHLTGYIGTITAEELKKIGKKASYSANDIIGKSGLEKLFEDTLRGQQGSKIYVTKKDVDGETTDKVIAEKPVKNGETVQLTIDVNVQEEIYNTYNGEAGTAAAVNPKTGETLALVSSPAYDPNVMSYGISQDQWEALEDNPKKPMLNRFSSTYASGSVIKPITAAIGLKNGTIKPDEGVTINGLDWSNGKGWGDYKVHRVSGTSSPVDLNDALNRSDNIYFAMHAVKMGSDKFVKGLHDFGLGEKFPFEYPIKQSQISNNGKLDNEVLLANTSYGQGEAQFSALHLATAYTTFLNEGDMLKPLLLTKDKKKQVWKKNLLNEKQAKEIQKDLRDVVVKGTGAEAKRKDFAVSGKTGTAELKASKDDKSGDENGWFVGYPTKKQEIVIAMMQEKTQKVGSSIVAKKVADILENLYKK